MTIEYKGSKVGFPIRRSSDQSSFAAPQGLSQRTTSFIASQRQGIHQMLLRHLIALMIDVRALGKRADTNIEKTCSRDFSQKHCLPNIPGQRPCGAEAGWRTRCLTNRVYSLFTISNIRAPLLVQKAGANLCDTGQTVNGGARRDRTDDLLNANQALSQLSYGPIRTPHQSRASQNRASQSRPDEWWAWDDSNVRPHPYQGCALTT